MAQAIQIRLWSNFNVDIQMSIGSIPKIHPAK